jgi:hypothetical protein
MLHNNPNYQFDEDFILESGFRHLYSYTNSSSVIINIIYVLSLLCIIIMISLLV